MEARQEVLVVVVDADRYQEAIDAWRRSAAVTQLLPPRLALVVPDDDPPYVPGTRWYTDVVPADVLLSLAPYERIFIAAWRDRRAIKSRPGDGLPWDAEGFAAPDEPSDEATTEQLPDSDR